MRIVTYNTRGSLGMDGVRSTRRIIETVRALSPDIVCFQEIHQRLPWSGREDQPAILSLLLGRPCLFQRNLHFGFGGYGVAIAFRGDRVSYKEHLLPSVKEQRGALEVNLRQVGGYRALTVFCTHWGLQAEERKRQADALAERIKAASGPVIVCGDLNEKPEGEGVRHLLASTRLLDAGSRQNQPTFVSDNPTARIDYILYSPDLAVQNMEVISSQASDHLPVLADLIKI